MEENASLFRIQWRTPYQQILSFKQIEQIDHVLQDRILCLGVMSLAYAQPGLEWS